MSLQYFGRYINILSHATEYDTAYLSDLGRQEFLMGVLNNHMELEVSLLHLVSKNKSNLCCLIVLFLWDCLNYLLRL